MDPVTKITKFMAATLQDGSTQVIYAGGQFQLD